MSVGLHLEHVFDVLCCKKSGTHVYSSAVASINKVIQMCQLLAAMTTVSI